ncbi:MAG: ATP-binding cassette domain-containing protein, partial [Oscillospiraceae bacterium]
MITVDKLKKSFAALDVLKGVSFTVDKGDVVAVIGSSGSGKSTLLRCLIDLEEINDG